MEAISKTPTIDSLEPLHSTEQGLETIYSKSRVIVADDNKEMANLIKSHLIINGYDVEVCNDGVELCEALQESDRGNKTPVDLVITDIRMPNMDGFSAIKNIRINHCSLKIIAITAFGSNETIAKAKLIGADLIISKPFNFEDLVKTVNQLIA